MRNIPLSVLLSFPVPNYVNPETRGSALLAVTGLFMGLVTIFFGLRMYSRLWLRRWFGMDDWLIIPAYVFTIATNVIVILANERYYWDRHVWDIPIPAIPTTAKVAMASKVLFLCAAGFTRMSLICFYYRLIGDANRKVFRWVLHIAMTYVVCLMVVFIFLSIFICDPVKAYWIWPATGHCMNEGTQGLVAGSMNCVADFLVTALPIPMVLRLSLPRKQRPGVIILLSLGFVVTVAGIVRTYYTWRATIHSYDQSWFSYPLWICAAVELDLGLLCACAPALKTLLTAWSPSFGRNFNKVGNMLSTKSSTQSSTGKRSANDYTFDMEETGHRSVTPTSAVSEALSRLPPELRKSIDRSRITLGTQYGRNSPVHPHHARDVEERGEKGFTTEVREAASSQEDIPMRIERPQIIRYTSSDERARLHHPALTGRSQEHLGLEMASPRSARNDQRLSPIPQSVDTYTASNELSWLDDGSPRGSRNLDAYMQDYGRYNREDLRGDDTTETSTNDGPNGPDMISIGRRPLQVPVHGDADGTQHHEEMYEEPEGSSGGSQVEDLKSGRMLV